MNVPARFCLVYENIETVLISIGSLCLDLQQGNYHKISSENAIFMAIKDGIILHSCVIVMINIVQSISLYSKLSLHEVRLKSHQQSKVIFSSFLCTMYVQNSFE